MSLDTSISGNEKIIRNQSMQLMGSTILYGSNVYHEDTVLLQKVQMGILRGQSTTLAGKEFAQDYLDRFISKLNVVPAYKFNTNFLNKLHSSEGATFEETLLESILNIEAAIAYVTHDFIPIEFTKIVEKFSSDEVSLIWESHNPIISREAAKVALHGLLGLLSKEICAGLSLHSVNFEHSFSKLKERAKKWQISTTTSVILMEARQRKIPYETLGAPLLRLGQGNKQKMIYASIPENTSFIAAHLCRNKRKSNRYLMQQDLPVPKQIKVNTVEKAIEAAKRLGFPVVLKPIRGKQANGVTVGLNSSQEIARAFNRAQTSSTNVIMEKFVQGDVYRLLVINGKFIAALKLEPPSVIGDGRKSISKLIGELNNDSRRNDILLYKVEIDDELLEVIARNKYSLHTILKEGEILRLRSAANAAIGGFHTDVTDIVHPDNQEMAIRAANLMGLSVGGVDFISKDIGSSYKEIGGSIIEMNARPGFCMHTYPRYGKTQPVAKAMLDMVFPGGDNGQIQKLIVVGSRRTNAIAQKTEKIIHMKGVSVGLLTKSKICINNHYEKIGKSKTRVALYRLLRNPAVESVITTTSPNRIVENGLQLSRVNIAAILNSEDSIDPETYQQCIEVIAKSKPNTIILDAENQAALKCLNEKEHENIVLIAIDTNIANAVLKNNKPNLIIMREKKDIHGSIVIRNQERILGKILLREIDCKNIEEVRHVKNKMFSIAMAYSYGISIKKIKQALL